MLQETQTPPTSENSGSKNLKITMGLAIGVLVIVAGVGLWWFFGRDTPDAVNIDTAAGGVIGQAGESSGGTDDGTIEGTWSVDTSTGEFDFNSATGTFAGFRIKEELAGIGDTEAVGRTGDVSGSFTIEGTTVTDAKITVDLSTIKTNDSMRDRRVQDALSTSKYPDATFELSEPIELGADAANGSTVKVDAEGELTIHGVTKKVTFPLEARLVNGTVVVVGSLDISFADYDVEVPSSMKVVSVEDHGVVELQLLLKR